MSEKEVLKWLDYVSTEVDENWDEEEYSHEIKCVCKAIDYAMEIIRSKKIVGSLTLDNKNYKVLGE